MLALPSAVDKGHESDGVRALRQALVRCEEEKDAAKGLGLAAWICAMTEADWEAEKHFIRKEIEYANGSLRPNAAARTGSEEPAMQLRGV